MRRRMVPIVAFAAFCGACGAESPARPSPTRETSRYLVLTGAVTEPVGAPVFDYLLKATDRDGTVDNASSQRMTIAGAEYRLFVREGPVTIEVAKDGYHTRVESFEVRANLRHDIEIEPLVAPRSFEGPFLIRLEADPEACRVLPPELLTRRYAVDVAQAGAALTIHMSDPALTGVQVEATLYGSALSFALNKPDWYYGGEYSLEEVLDENRRLTITGQVTAQVGDADVSGRLTGEWTLTRDGLAYFNCEGTHEVRFERR